MPLHTSRKSVLSVFVGAALALACMGCSSLDIFSPSVPLPQGAKLVFEDTFDKGLDNWATEGVGTLGVTGGRVVMDPRTGKSDEWQARNLWCKKPLPINFRIEMTVHPMEPRPEQKEPCSILFAFCARMADPARDVIRESPNRDQNLIYFHGLKEWLAEPQSWDVRKREIPPMKSYAISWYRVVKEGSPNVQLRKNPGYHLLLEAPQTLLDLRASPRRIIIEKVDNSIKFYEEGRLWFQCIDDAKTGPVLDGGYFCVRPFLAKVAVDDVRVYELP